MVVLSCCVVDEFGGYVLLPGPDPAAEREATGPLVRFAIRGFRRLHPVFPEGAPAKARGPPPRWRSYGRGGQLRPQTVANLVHGLQLGHNDRVLHARSAVVQHLHVVG